MWTRLRHLGLALALVPGLLFDARRRALLAEMLAFCRSLPDRLTGPLNDALEGLSPTDHDLRSLNDPKGLRDLTDLAALLDRGSPLGLCLRRSLVRYRFLRRAGLPIDIQFGAKLTAGRPVPGVARLGGHAWVTLDGTPYFEEDENWRGFTVMFSFPPAAD